jgi:hypothetical protein
MTPRRRSAPGLSPTLGRGRRHVRTPNCARPATLPFRRLGVEAGRRDPVKWETRGPQRPPTPGRGKEMNTPKVAARIQPEIIENVRKARPDLRYESKTTLIRLGLLSLMNGTPAMPDPIPAGRPLASSDSSEMQPAH